VDEVVAAVAARFGVPPDRVRPLPVGAANHVHLLGDDLVLRVPRSAEMAADLRKEAAIIPVATRAGIRTPALVGFDDAVPYLVVERVAGTDLAGRRRTPRLLRQVGRELAAIHRLDPPPVPVDADRIAPEALLGDLLAAGRLDAENADWLAGCFGRLPPPDTARVLIHGDLAPQNLIADDDRLTGIVDWGDALLADPATDFAKMPLVDVPAMLTGYREIARPGCGFSAPSGGPGAGSGGAGPAEGAILRHHLLWALGRLAEPAPRPGERHWTAPPASRLLGLLRFLASDAAEPWRRLLSGSRCAAGDRWPRAAS
jgi:hygromycin-B 7''-O-kinase